IACCSWAQAPYALTPGQRLSACKQRIDFTIACLALVIAYFVISQVAWTPVRFWLWGKPAPSLATLGVMAVCVAMLLGVPARLSWAQLGRRAVSLPFVGSWAAMVLLSAGFVRVPGTPDWGALGLQVLWGALAIGLLATLGALALRRRAASFKLLDALAVL